MSGDWRVDIGNLGARLVANAIGVVVLATAVGVLVWLLPLPLFAQLGFTMAAFCMIAGAISSVLMP